LKERGTEAIILAERGATMADEQAQPTIPGFRLTRPIGAGGMGSVYEAERLSTHETFAVKFIREHLLTDRRSFVRFEREIDALRAIRHPNVVNVFEWSLGDPDAGLRPYVVMELLEGESLEQFLRREEVPPPLITVGIILQVLEGLAAAHAVGVLHRDLAPSNLFVQRHASGRLTVKLVDFGLARQVVAANPGSGVTQEGTLLGKPAYVAPELFHARPLDERADLFACGVVLFRMLYGRLPYAASGGQGLWVERWTERDAGPEYPCVRDFAGRAPDVLARVVSRALRKDPAERYASAREMQADLLVAERWLVDHGVVGPLTDASPAGSATPSSTTGDGGSTTAAERSTVTRPAAPSSTMGENGATAVGERSTVTRLVAFGRRRRGPLVAAALVLLAPAALVSWWIADRPAGPSASTQRVVAVGAPEVAVPAVVAEPVADRPSIAVLPPAPAIPPPVVAAASDPDAGAQPAGAERTGPELQPARSVHIDFAGLPPGAQVTVGGRAVDEAMGIDVVRSTAPLAVRVVVPGGRFERWTGTVVADRSQVIRPHLVARVGVSSADSGAAGDAGPGVIQGRMGTEFLTDLRGEH
jgi:serine/threonine protein kinase